MSWTKLILSWALYISKMIYKNTHDAWNIFWVTLYWCYCGRSKKKRIWVSYIFDIHATKNAPTHTVVFLIYYLYIFYFIHVFWLRNNILNHKNELFDFFLNESPNETNQIRRLHLRIRKKITFVNLNFPTS